MTAQSYAMMKRLRNWIFFGKEDEMTHLEALKMSHTKWCKLAKTTEEEFRLAGLFTELGGNWTDCGLCRLYFDAGHVECPLYDKGAEVCCYEFANCEKAFNDRDYRAYIQNAEELRDRLARLIEDENKEE